MDVLSNVAMNPEPKRNKTMFPACAVNVKGLARGVFNEHFIYYIKLNIYIYIYIQTYPKHPVVKSLSILIKLLPDCKASLIVPEGAERLYRKLGLILDDDFGLRQAGGDLPRDQVDVCRKQTRQMARVASSDPQAPFVHKKRTAARAHDLTTLAHNGLLRIFMYSSKLSFVSRTHVPLRSTGMVVGGWTLGRVLESVLSWDFSTVTLLACSRVRDKDEARWERCQSEPRVRVRSMKWEREEKQPMPLLYLSQVLTVRLRHCLVDKSSIVGVTLGLQVALETSWALRHILSPWNTKKRISSSQR